MDSAKLTLFFNDPNGNPQIDNNMARRDLDPEVAPMLDQDDNPMWIIGRGIHSNITFDSLMVSRRQAYIRCWLLESRYVWQIRHDMNARNSSYKDNRDGIITLPDQWLNIHDYDTFFFGRPEFGFSVTTAPNDTMQAIPDDEGPPTVNATMEAAIASAAAEQIQIDNPWEALYYGLKDIPNSRLAIYALFALGALAAWLGAEVLKHLND